MAYPTTLTLASGKTVYEGDPDNDDGITSRQVQVSVTYQLERGDADLLAVTARKAQEVEAAQAAVWRQVRKEQTEMELPPGGGPPDDEDDPLRGEDDGDESGDDPPFYDGSPDYSQDYPEDDGSGSMPPPHSLPAQGVPSCHTGPAGGDGHDTSGHNGSGGVPPAITKPQKLAIGAQARRLGLSEVALAEIVRERFGKTSFTPRYAVDRLTKAEADSLLRALQALGQGEEDAPQVPAGLTRH